MPFDLARIWHEIRNWVHAFPMDQKHPDELEYAFEVKSLTELLMKWLWVFLCALMWIGAVLSLFTAPLIQALGGFAVASLCTLWLWWLFKRRFPK
jgi:hypothetical protein